MATIRRLSPRLQLESKSFRFLSTSLKNNLSDLLFTDRIDSIEVFNPASPTEVVGTVPLQTRGEAVETIEAAEAALKSWQNGTTAAQRSILLRRWSELIQENKEAIAAIITRESGKPLAEAKGEVQYGVSFLEYFAGEAIRTTGAGGGFLTPTPFKTEEGSPRGEIMAVNQAVGVTGMITPWNFPIAMITRKVGPALAAGCTAIVKPSELTPLTGVVLQKLALQAGIPEGVFQLITTNGTNTNDVGVELCTNQSVQKISFTGSTKVGKLLMKHASSTVKRLSLELGGNAAFIVFDDAKLEQAVDAAISSKFRNAGQTCVTADRFLIHSILFDEFVGRFCERAESLVTGPGLEDNTNIGPLITAQAADTVHAKVREAIQEGASCPVGGSKLTTLGPNFVEPTVLTHVDMESQVWKQENFGPVAAMRSFDSEEEALNIANDCRLGLASYFCTQDMSRAFRFSKGLETGIVGINDGIISTCVAPFGGVKESGLGREGSVLGLSEYTETKYIMLNP